MKRTRFGSALGSALVLFSLMACDDKQASPTPTPSASATAPTPTPEATVMPSASASAAAKKKIACDPAANPVVFNEPGLEAEVRKKLSKPDGPITKDDLAKVKSVNLTQVQVDELDPCIFPKLTGVHDIFLGKGELTDLVPLSTLAQVISLRATGTQVADITPLARMVHMDRLDLSHSPVSDITTIASMTDLTELSLDDTSVNDLSPLAKLTKLEHVSIRNTGVKDLKPLLGAKKLKSLDVGGSPIEDTHVLDPLVATGLKIKTS